MSDASDCHEAHTEIKRFVERRVDTCRKEVSAELHALNATLSEFTDAFHHGEDGKPDFTGHRKYHDAKVKAAEAEERFWTELRLDVAKKGVWGLLIIVLGLIFVGVQVKLGLFPSEVVAMPPPK